MFRRDIIYDWLDIEPVRSDDFPAELVPRYDWLTARPLWSSD